MRMRVRGLMVNLVVVVVVIVVVEDGLSATGKASMVLGGELHLPLQLLQEEEEAML